MSLGQGGDMVRVVCLWAIHHVTCVFSPSPVLSEPSAVLNENVMNESQLTIAGVPPIPLPSLEELKNIFATENRRNHTIRLRTDSLGKYTAIIIAASETQVFILVHCYAFRSSVTVWVGHPLIPASWIELFSPRPLRVGEAVVISSLGSDGRSMCLGFQLGVFTKRLFFKCFDIVSRQWTDMCTFVFRGFILPSIKHTSLGWLALTQTLQLYRLTETQAILLKCLPFSFDTRHALGHNNLFLHSPDSATLTVYPFERLENPQQLVCQEYFEEFYESDGQLYSVEFFCESGAMCVRKLSMEGGVCKLQKDLFTTRVRLDPYFRVSLFDRTNIYIVSCTGRDVYLTTQSHKPPSLQSLALLSIQKMFGVKRKFKNNRRNMIEGVIDSVCDVWEGGITIDEFRERFGYRGKNF